MDISKHLEKAAEAGRKKNFDYAISLYHQVLLLKPDHGEARRELRQVLVRRSDYKKVPPFIALLGGLPHRVGMLFGALLRKPAQVALAAEAYLKNDPRNSSVNRALAEALERDGHRNGAVAVWEFLGDDERLGDDALKRAGALYYQLRQMGQALGCYEAVLKRSPRDAEAEKMRKNLAAEGVLSSGSYDPGRSSRDLARNQDRKQQLEIEQKAVTSADEREILLGRLREEVAGKPADRRVRRQLVDQLVKDRRYDEAAQVLAEGVEQDPDSTDLRDRLGDVRLLAFDHSIREARQAAAAGDAAAETDLKDLARERAEFELTEVARRVKQHPTDLDLRFRLGRLLLGAGQLDEAILNLQHSVKDPRRRADSLAALGIAFESKGHLELAAKQYESALEELEPSSDRATEVVYSLAVLLEKNGDVAGARQRFESIYERDIHYRDVAGRLEALRSAAAPVRPEPAAAERRPAAAERSESSAEKERGPEGSADSVYGFKD